jgi:hypothetical protein
MNCMSNKSFSLKHIECTHLECMRVRWNLGRMWEESVRGGKQFFWHSAIMRLRFMGVKSQM